MRLFSMLVAVFLAGPLAAQEVQDCNRAFQFGSVVDPESMNAKAYANGQIRFVVVHDGRSDASSAQFLAVFSPLNSDETKRQCHLIGREVGVGYAAIALNLASADYAASTGLTVEVPARIYLPEDGFTNSTLLSINVNQAAQNVTVTQELGNE